MKNEDTSKTNYYGKKLSVKGKHQSLKHSITTSVRTFYLMEVQVIVVEESSLHET